LDFSNALVILGCIVVLWIIGKIFSVPLKALFKLIINSVLGGLLIFIINLIGAVWNFHIGLNIVTAILVGILGIPGAILLVILKLFI
jgi:inhibitor of the pro-sigma K processing machinery